MYFFHYIGVNEANIEKYFVDTQEAYADNDYGDKEIVHLFAMDESPFLKGLNLKLHEDGSIYILGLCGKHPPPGQKHHECFNSGIKVTSREEFIAATKDYRLGNNVSLVMLTPLNPPPRNKDKKRVRSLPVYCLCTCLCSTKDDMKKLINDLIKSCQKICQKLNYRNHHVVGIASDGARNRTTLQDNNSRIKRKPNGKDGLYYLDDPLMSYGGILIPRRENM
jgi:hypothetical protein